ncbi:cobalamin biosynthesis protein [Alteromonas sp. ASW11-19]|uniref:Cobalamin biosynthesis protein n=1 Tax=Alteromonas salexigens TaxID=2982530 RepID=A0ABT2VQ66_9ALTE|nr:cobalamin biosynthesis protein [Alteromonas salexigens]MCU7555455.1 cobalamin biosynthesis protein [Alteromonas salexigens]
MEALLTHSVLSSLVILLMAIVADAVWRWPAAYHPLTLMQLLAARMGDKVLPGANHAPMQHYISGTLAAVVVVVPLVSLLGLLVYLAEYPVFFEAVILVAVLDYNHERYRFRQVLNSVGKNKKTLSRESVGYMVLRDCDRLTDIGIAKAAIEALLLKFYYHYVAVIFWFLLAGPIAALTYRLLLLLSWQWHPRRAGYQHFGMPVRKLVRLMHLLPSLIGALCMLVVTAGGSALKALKNAPARDRTSLLLAAFAGGNHIRLGGPAFYAGRKTTPPRVGGARDVKYSDMVYCRRAITRAGILVASLALLTLTVLAAITGQVSVP